MTRTQLHTRRIVILGLLIAMEIVLTRFVAQQMMPTPNIRLSLGFIPIAAAGMLFGPLWGALAGALADFIGINLFSGLPWFPGFTLTAGLAGAVYGLLLHRAATPVKWWRILTAAAVVVIFIQLGIETYWLYMIHGRGVIAIMPERLIRTGIMLPVQIVALRMITGPRFSAIFQRLRG